MTDPEGRILDAIGFMLGQTVQEIADKAEVEIKEVQKVVRGLLSRGDLVRKGRLYKYENSDDDLHGYHHQIPSHGGTSE